jgi:XTP/dITP diphosphohydrolase
MTQDTSRKPQQIVLASNNRGKLAELNAMLKGLNLEVLPISLFTDHVPEETGTSFLENALIKARHAARIANLPAIADDSGLEVDALGGAPGVQSARYAAADASVGNSSDAANNRKLLDELANVDEAHRTARFRCVLAFVQAGNETSATHVEAVWEGHILRRERGAGGFGYDPLFQPLGMSVSSAELTAEQKNLLSHRGQAMRKLLAVLQSISATS